MSFAIKYAKLTSEYYNHSYEDCRYSLIKKKSNELFENWLVEKYGSLCNLPSSRPVMVHHIVRWLAAQDCKKKAIIVIDGMSLSQWVTVLPEIECEIGQFNITNSSVFAWIPTLTSISRQSIFAGKPPLFFPESIFFTYRESKHWNAFWRNHGATDKQIQYINVTNKEIYENELSVINDQVKYLAIVVGKIDKIMHGMQLGQSGMHNQIKLWFKQGEIKRLLKKLIDQDFEVIITSDHGNIQALGIGNPSEGAIAEVKGQRTRIYNDIMLRAKVNSQFPNTILWNASGLPSGLYPLIASGQESFVSVGQSTVAHGGISIEETIVPFITIKK